MPLNPNINRVSVMIDQYEKNIAQRLATGKVMQEQVDQLHRTLDMELSEYCRFHQLKSIAAGDKLTLEEAQTIYLHLGTTVETFNAQPVAVKAVLTKVFEELLSMEIGRKRRTG